MICTHRINPGCRIARFLVASPPWRDLLIGANYLFVAAMVAITSAGRVHDEQWNLFSPKF
jgi:hypothetical protein